MTSAWWVHLSTAMVFGLAFATVLTLVFCPVMLSAPTVWKEGWQRLRGRFGKDDGGTPDKAEAAQAGGRLNPKRSRRRRSSPTPPARLRCGSGTTPRPAHAWG
jgi:hypothetical protein